MISLAPASTHRNPIAFPDESFEVGIVVRAFLDAIYTGAIDDCTYRDNINVTMYLVDFARKWECQMLIDSIERVVKFDVHVLGGQPCANCDEVDLFLLAVKLNRYELAGRCLRTEPATVWNEEVRFLPADSLSPNLQSDEPVTALSKMHPIEGVDIFDLSAGSYSLFLELSPNIVWILLRSTYLAKKSENGKSFRINLGDEFVKLTRVACAYLIYPA